MTGIMQGFPPPPDRQVTLGNWREAPFSTWAFHHVREIVPSADIANDPAGVRPLEPGPALDPDAIVFADAEGRSWTTGAFLEASATDALVIARSGRIVFETYANGMDAGTPHILMSVSKSMLGLLAGVLVDRGVLDTGLAADTVMPELRETAYRDATIRHLLDMRTGIAFDEDYDAMPEQMVAYRKASNWNPVEAGDPPTDLRSFYRILTAADGPHGRGFHYVSPNTDLLALLFERLAGERYADLFARLLFRPAGAGRCAYVTVDRLGAARAAGGMCMTARDLARIGQLVAEGGSVDGVQVVPAAWIDDIATSADLDGWNAGGFAPMFPGATMHYRSKWYIRHGGGPLLFGVGVHGQNLFVDRARELVIVKFSSQARPLDPDMIDLTMRWVEACRNGYEARS